MSEPQSTPSPAPEHRSLADLIRELREEGSVLLRQEVALARTEIAEKINRMIGSSAGLAAGAALLYAGLIVLLLGVGALVSLGLVEAGLHPTVSAWLGPVLTGFVVLLIGAVTLISAKKRLSRESMVPEQTAASLREDKEWVKHKFQKA